MCLHLFVVCNTLPIPTYMVNIGLFVVFSLLHLSYTCFFSFFFFLWSNFLLSEKDSHYYMRGSGIGNYSVDNWLVGGTLVLGSPYDPVLRSILCPHPMGCLLLWICFVWRCTTTGGRKVTFPWTH